MEILDTTRLNAMGYSVLNSQTDRSGEMVFLVVTPDGQRLAMLRSDIAELIEGRTNVDEITRLNRGAKMKPPWPTVNKPL